ncbi:unnamed protein product [Closterium sp. NIES-65]|nr:unnamed protein product [Closterium sp. NIES-65]
MGSILEEHNVRLLGSPDSSASELVVLGHGFGTDQSVWQHIVPHLLDDDYRLLLLDLMGAGSTNPDNFSFARYSSLHGYADDLLAILEEVGAQQCTYVGHSVSGMIGCIAAIARPEAFKKIVLIGASPRYLNDVDYLGGFEQEDLNQLLAAMHSNFPLCLWLCSIRTQTLSVRFLPPSHPGDLPLPASLPHHLPSSLTFLFPSLPPSTYCDPLSTASLHSLLPPTRYLNDVDYFGGFEQEDLNQLFAAMHSNFRAWVSGFAPLAVGADINCAAVQEFSRTFFCIRPDIALSVSKTIFQSDMRSILPQAFSRRTFFCIRPDIALSPSVRMSLHPCAPSSPTCAAALHPACPRWCQLPLLTLSVCCSGGVHVEWFLRSMRIVSSVSSLLALPP